MANEADNALNDKLAAFSRRLDARVREFKERGEFSDIHEAFAETLKKRQEFVKERLDSAIHSGTTGGILKYEIERDFNGLPEDFAQWEKQLDAETMKGHAKRT
jgi:hypothetical protein